MPDKLTAHEAAELLGYHPDHIYRLLKAKVIRGEQFNRVWMIDRAEVDRVKALQDDKGNLPRGTLKAFCQLCGAIAEYESRGISHCGNCWNYRQDELISLL